MAMNLAPVLKQRFFDANGNPLAGGKLYTYQAGTTTPLATYTDSAGGTANANPVVLDANGEANVWLDNSMSYKFILKNSLDTTQWTSDNVSGVNLLADGTVTTTKLANDSVTHDKLKDDADTDLNRAVTTNHIRNSAVTTAKIADANVTTVKILDSNVTTAKIADANVTTVKILDANVTTAKIADGAVTRAKREALGQQVSSSCGSFTTTSGSFVDVTNLSVTITTTGRPVFIALVPTSAAGSIGASSTTQTFMGSAATVIRGATEVLWSSLMLGTTTNDVSITAGTMSTIDAVAAGTYTYKAQLRATVIGSTARATDLKLVVFEL